MLVWRDDEIRYNASVGWADIEAGVPIARDTLFRIASLSKPVTSVAALMLVEEGRIALDEPIARWAPEFRSMRVLRAGSGELDDTMPAARAITFEDLLTHRAGFTYGAFWPGPLGQAYAAALGADIDSHVVPDDWITRLADLPLIDQPGATLHYGVATELLGLLIARIEDAPLGDVLERRLFRPLGMRDTAFVVPAAQRHRRAATYGFSADGTLERFRIRPGGPIVEERLTDMCFVSAGAGLWSTVDDYLAFARLFIGDGAVDDVRVLRPETLAMMMANRLTPAQRVSAEVARMPVFASGHGFGLGVAVVMEPEQAEPLVCGGSRGAVGWPGAFGGWWRADPAAGTVMIFLSHNMLEPGQLARGIGLGVYDAITRFQREAAP